MTARQKLELRRSKIRERLGEIAALEGDALTDEIRSEAETLATELKDSELRLRCALQAEGEGEETVETDTPDAEERERLELRSKAKVGRFVRAALAGRPLEGAEAELSEAEGCDGRLPLVLLTADPERRAVSPGPDAGTETVTQPTIPAVFERGASAAFGVVFPMVDNGQAAYPVITTPPPAGLKAKGADADSTAAAYTVISRKPQRVTGAVELRAEDVALFGALEDDLRSSLLSAIEDGVDGFVFSGSARDLFTQAADVAVGGDVIAFGTAVATVAALVDGKHARSLGDMRGLIGPPTFAKLAGTFQANDSMSAFDYLEGKMAGLRVSDRAPAVANNGQRGLVSLAGSMAPIRVPVWRGVELIRDPYSGAASGKTVLTAVVLVGDPVVPHGQDQLKEIHPKLSA